MLTEDKYYIITRDWPKVPYPEIEKHNCDFAITLSQKIELPYFDLYIDKLKKDIIERPKVSEKCKKISRDVYEDCFNLSFSSIENFNWEEAEYYWDQKSPMWSDVIMFTTDPKNKFCLHIDIRDSIDSLLLSFRIDTGFTYRPTYRRKAKKISRNTFEALLQETLKFIKDQNNYFINVSEFVKKVRLLGQGEILVSPQGTNSKLMQVISQLELKKEEITSRLVNNDRDTEIQRSTLRGEKEGIEYSLRAIKKLML